MKKIFIMLILIAFLTGCSKPENIEKTSEMTIENTEVAKEDPDSETVSVVLPAFFFQDQPPSQDMINESIKAGTITGGKLNEDGSVTYLMTKDQNKEMLTNMKSEIESHLEDLIIISKDAFKKITFNSDASEFTVFVDKANYSESDSFNAISLYVYAGYYRAILGEKDLSTKVNFVDQESDEVINTIDSKNFVN